MQIDVQLPQLNAVLSQIRALHDKIDAVIASLAVVQAAPTAAPPVKRPRARAFEAAATDVKPVTTNGEAVEAETEHDDAEADEAALRARVEFEAKRTTRAFGVGGTRAAIGSVAHGVLRVDDVPVEQLAAVLTALQAL